MAYFILYQFGYINAYPTNKNLINWDAVWYKKIQEAGYHYSEATGGTMAFFPLFPFLWRWFGLNVIGITIFNYLIFLLGFYLLSNNQKWSFKQNLLFLSTPSLFFCFVPYSEALFFLGSSLLLIGLNKDRIAIILLGLIITTLTRSVGVVFIPALIFTYFYLSNEKSYKHNLLRILLGTAVIISGSLIAFLVQYLYTGKWFVFFEVQKHWRRQFQIPTLPLTTISNFNMLWLDGMAFLFALLAGFYILFLLLSNYKNPLNKIKVRPEVLFSLVYVAMIGFIATFFSGVRSKDYGTSLMSINRFIFATPFFIIFTLEFSNNKEIDRKLKGLAFTVIMMISWLMLGLDRKIPGNESYFPTLSYFFNMTVFVVLYMYIQFKPGSKWLYFIYCINLIIMAFLFNRFLNAGWVG
ncbi:hypothetical protein A9P82_08790 [Arachidicoccus ginsenosidimutans]|nr:hypothetical protein A9P82_08790 [Arachidicoccus sp. BS20]